VKRFLFLLFFLVSLWGGVQSARAVCGTPGKDGIGPSGGVVDSYFSSAQSAFASDKTVQLDTTTRVGATNSIPVGDLLMLWQTQGASIDSSDTDTYGSGVSQTYPAGYTSLNGAGHYEFVRVTSPPDATGKIGVAGDGPGGGLKFSYVYDTTSTPKQIFQVIRVPQYSSLTLTSALQPVKYNGATGGIIIVDVAGTLTFNTAVGADVYQTGYRGGFAPQNDYVNSNSGSVWSVNSKPYNGAGKGGGIVGSPHYVWNGASSTNNGVEGYPGGDGGRGAPGNAGGGGNAHNAGGGGGSNSGGGGKGGYPWEGAALQAGTLTDTVPNNNGTTRQVAHAGGAGGFPLRVGASTPFTDRLFMGGGGGGGDANDSTSGVRGGVGAGVVLLRAGNFAGSTTINAQGDNGDRGVFNNNPDGAGGGGAGGTVILVSRGTGSASFSVNVSGGAGGNTDRDPVDPASGVSSGTTAHGPGGGGGGGTVLYSNGLSVSTNLAGGTAGFTNESGTVHINHGALPGFPGLKATLSSTDGNNLFDTSDACGATLSVVKTTSTPTLPIGSAQATYAITVSNTGAGGASGVVVDDVLPSPFTYDPATQVTATYGTGSGGPATLAGTGTATPRFGTAGGDATNSFVVGPGSKVTLTFSVKVNSATLRKYDNSASASFADPNRIDNAALLTPGGKDSNGATVPGTNYNGSLPANTGEDVTITPNSTTSVSGAVYLDANANGTRENSEGGATLNGFFVKLVLKGAAVATSAVPVSPTDGTYSFAGVYPGVYSLVLDDNATLTDIAPTIPAGYSATEAAGGVSNVAVGSVQIQNQNFGLFAGLSLSGRVFEDSGTGGSVANDAIQNGAEPGIGGVSLQLKSGATVIANTTTNAAGDYSFSLPASYSGQTLSVVETNAVGYLSSGGSAGNTGGAYSLATDTLSWTFNSASGALSGVNFADIRQSRLQNDGTALGTRGGSVNYPHVFTAGTAGTVSFSLSQVANPPSGWTAALYLDANGNGKPDAGDSLIDANSPPISVVAGQKLNLVVVNYVPQSAPDGSSDQITLSAVFTPAVGGTNPAILAQSLSRGDLTTVAPQNGLALSKAVDKSTAKSGDLITYTITYTNTGNTPLSDLVISDGTPAFTTFSSATYASPLSNNLTGCTITAPAIGNAGSLTWKFTGTLAPGNSGVVTFVVKLQ